MSLSSSVSIVHHADETHKRQTETVCGGMQTVVLVAGRLAGPLASIMTVTVERVHGNSINSWASNFQSCNIMSTTWPL